MPHVEIQYSQNLGDFDFRPLLQSISQALVIHCAADLSAVMARTLEVSDCVINGQLAYDQALCFVKITMKAGRSDHQKISLAAAVESLLRAGVLLYAHERGLSCHPRILLSDLPKTYYEVQ